MRVITVKKNPAKGGTAQYEIPRIVAYMKVQDATAEVDPETGFTTYLPIPFKKVA